MARVILCKIFLLFASLTIVKSYTEDLQLFPQGEHLTWDSLLFADSLFPLEYDQVVPVLSKENNGDFHLQSAQTVLHTILSNSVALNTFYSNYLKKYGNEISKRTPALPSADDPDQNGIQRMEIFKENVLEIAEHNLRAYVGLETWTKGVNSFTYLTSEEFHAHFTGSGPPRGNSSSAVDSAFQSESPTDIPDPHPMLKAPASKDWRDSQVVSSVKHQQTCGSCYAFGAMSTLESALAIKYGKEYIYDLSEQEIVDCSKDYGNNGCSGGLATNSYNYINRKGIAQEGRYPYESKVATCRTSSSSAQTSRLNGLKIVHKSLDPRNGKNENGLAEYIANYGPVNVIVDAVNWESYNGGVYDGPCEESVYAERAHLVSCVGYTPDYWILKNSWGQWGEKGFMRLKRGNNRCCISCWVDAVTSASF